MHEQVRKVYQENKEEKRCESNEGHNIGGLGKMIIGLE